MEIKVIGAGCDKCTKLYQNLQQAIDELGITAHVEKVDDLMEIVRLGVMTTPALMIDGKILAAGRAPNVKALRTMLEHTN